MNSPFDDRERGFEAKFAHDEDFRFRVHARRDKLFAHWAAERAGLTADETVALVAAAIHIPDRAEHDAALLARISETLSSRGAAASGAELHTALHHCEDEARQQLLAIAPEHPAAG